jgi:integrase
MYTNAKMNEYIKDVAAVCGIGKHLTTHTARKTFATMMSAGGVPLETIRDMLGHSSVTVTERYYVKVTARRIFRDLAPIIAKLTREQVTEGAGGPDNEPAALVLATDPTSSGN